MTDTEERKMKSKTILVTVLSLAVVIGGYGLVQAHGGQSRGGSGSGWFGMGSGHMGGSSWDHMGSGGHMSGSGWGHMGGDYTRGSGGPGYGHNNGWRGDRQVTSEEAREIAEYNLGGNPYIKVGKLTERSEGFEVEIVTSKNDELVNRLLVEKETGRIFPIFE
jgi:hypothetical protein